MDARCQNERVSERSESRRSIGIFTFCNFNNILQRHLKNANLYNRMDARCQNERVPERSKSRRSIRIFMFFVLAHDTPDVGSGVTRTAVSDSTPLT